MATGTFSSTAFSLRQWLAWRQLAPPALVPITVIVAGWTVFLFVVVTFTNVSAWVADQTTVSRATRHFAPVAAVFSALAFRAFALRWADRRAIGDAPGA